jgi:hypothetical protein
MGRSKKEVKRQEMGRSKKEVKPIEWEKLKKWERKRKRICLGRLLEKADTCHKGCCGELHTRKDECTCGVSLGARNVRQPFVSCDCYPIETAIKLAWKIKMGLVKYDGILG